MSKWASICQIEDILPSMGRCALIEGKQVAIFRVKEALYAIDNFCPFSEANIISRGIIGNIADKIVVASPLYKQHFDLVTGQCIEDEAVRLPTYAVRLKGDIVQLAA